MNTKAQKRNGIYVDLIANGKINNYLRVAFLNTGKFGIETARRKPEKWEYNVSMPVFNTQLKAENWLTTNYKKMSVTASIDINEPWIEYENAPDGGEDAKDYYRKYIDGGGVRYMDGESLTVMDIDNERGEITLYNENNMEGYERFTIGMDQYGFDFVEFYPMEVSA